MISLGYRPSYNPSGYTQDGLDSPAYNAFDRIMTKSSWRDMGVIIDCKLKFQDHIKEKINKAYSMLGSLRRNFKEMDVSFISSYKVFVRSHLEYADQSGIHITRT